MSLSFGVFHIESIKRWSGVREGGRHMYVMLTCYYFLLKRCLFKFMYIHAHVCMCVCVDDFMTSNADDYYFHYLCKSLCLRLVPSMFVCLSIRVNPLNTNIGCGIRNSEK